MNEHRVFDAAESKNSSSATARILSAVTVFTVLLGGLTALIGSRFSPQDAAQPQAKSETSSSPSTDNVLQQLEKSTKLTVGMTVDLTAMFQPKQHTKEGYCPAIRLGWE